MFGWHIPGSDVVGVRLRYEAYNGDLSLAVRYHTYSNSTEIINIHDKYVSGTFGYPSTVFYVQNDGFSCRELVIEGVNITEGTNEYVMDSFTYANIDINSTYFYGKGSRLYFNYTADDNSKLEYIQFGFNITHQLTTNRTLSFTSLYNGINPAYFMSNYTDTTLSIFSIYESKLTQTFFLTQNKYISAFGCTLLFILE